MIDTPAKRSSTGRLRGGMVAAAAPVCAVGTAFASSDPPLAGRTAIGAPIDGQRRPQPIATLEVGAHATCTLTRDDAPFEPKSLFMRPLQCLPASTRLPRRRPYPDQKTARITAGDLSSLSYDRLFLLKPGSEFGIDLWNGRYDRLPAMGDRPTGPVKAVDLDDLPYGQRREACAASCARYQGRRTRRYTPSHARARMTGRARPASVAASLLL